MICKDQSYHLISYIGTHHHNYYRLWVHLQHYLDQEILFLEYLYL